MDRCISSGRVPQLAFHSSCQTTTTLLQAMMKIVCVNNSHNAIESNSIQFAEFRFECSEIQIRTVRSSPRAECHKSNKLCQRVQGRSRSLPDSRHGIRHPACFDDEVIEFSLICFLKENCMAMYAIHIDINSKERN